MADIYTGIRSRSLPINLRIAALARRQHGVVAVWQLLLVGLSRSAIQRRIGNGLLYRLHPGAYAVGHPQVSGLGRIAAARLAIGPGSAVSGLASAATWKFHDFPLVAPVEILALRGRGRGRWDQPLAHAVASAAGPRDGRGNLGHLGAADPRRDRPDRAGLADAQALRGSRPHPPGGGEAMREVLGRCRNGKGTATLRELSGSSRTPAPRTESHAEYRFFRLWEAGGGTLPEVNVKVCGHLVDFLWRDLRFIIELDGPSYHDRKGQGERDRQRDVVLSLADTASSASARTGSTRRPMLCSPRSRR